jgi:dihydrofolate reductase/thymidylate synthase
MNISLIVAYDSNYGIGKNGSLPWDIKEEMKHFSSVTKNACVVMGKNTYLSLPTKGLSGRQNIVLSLTPLDDPNVDCVSSIEQVFGICQRKELFVIGGSKVYQQFLSMNLPIQNIYVTQIHHDYQCDTFFPQNQLDQYLQQNHLTPIVVKGKGLDYKNNFVLDYTITHYQFRSDEKQYLNLLETILREDPEGRQTRNGKTYSIFGPQLSFDLSNGVLPMITTRKMFIRGIFEELIFFIQGQTNTKILEDKKIYIWKGNTSKEFLASRGLPYEEGDMGPMYGYQWRHFGAEYKGQGNRGTVGYDQLEQLLKQLVQDPSSRRHLLTTYHPGVVDQSVLAPCHGLVVQFYVQGGMLDCKMYQRSCDTVLGEPFNITSYALLTHLIAHVCGLKARKLIVTLGDAHIYEQHVEGVKEQLKREPFSSPVLVIKKQFTGTSIQDRIDFLEGITMDDIEVQGYRCHPAIKFEMVA